MDLSPGSSGRIGIALAGLSGLAAMVWWTMDPGKFRSLTWVLLGFFAFRIVLARLGSR